MFVAKVGFGKSELLSKFAMVDGVYYVNDITAYAIHKLHKQELREGKIKHIVIPDLLNMLNKPKEQAEAFITFLNALIEEGIVRVESRHSNFVVEFPVKVGLITAIAQPDYVRRQDRWAAIGFLSRLLIIRYRYSQAHIDKILRSIILREYHQSSPAKIKFPPETEVFLPPDIGEDIKIIALRTKDPHDELGARRLKQLQTLTMGLALTKGRTRVNREDLAELAHLSQFFTPPQMMIAKDRYGVIAQVENPESYKEL